MTNKAAEAAATKYANAEHKYNENFPPEVQHNFESWVDSKLGFIAGYEAGAQAERERIWERCKQMKMFVHDCKHEQGGEHVVELPDIKQIIFGGADEPPTEAK